MLNLRVLLFIAAATLLVYFIHTVLKRMIDPRRSAGYFFLYIAVHLITVMLMVFIFGLVINHYKEFFFKR